MFSLCRKLQSYRTSILSSHSGCEHLKFGYAEINDFDYLDPTGHKQKLHYYFSKSSSDYLSAPADAINYIREILVSVGVLREAA